MAKDISWLWRTAYNCAVQGCTEWGDGEAASRLFDVSREVSSLFLLLPTLTHAIYPQQLLELYCTLVLTEPDAELTVYIANASFAAVAGKGEYQPNPHVVVDIIIP